MKKRFLSLTLCICILMAGCSNRGYKDGYSDGFVAGYQAALEANQNTSEEANRAATVPANIQEGSPPQTEDLFYKFHKSIPEPKNGYIFKDFNPSYADLFPCVAPLTIETDDNFGYYFVISAVEVFTDDSPTGNAFEDEQKNILKKSVSTHTYVRADSTVNLDVPLGKYRIYYACGTSWYGDKYLFGPETEYYKCDGSFTFEETTSGYSGYTISLTQVPNGNLKTHKISETDFPSLSD